MPFVAPAPLPLSSALLRGLSTHRSPVTRASPTPLLNRKRHRPIPAKAVADVEPPAPPQVHSVPSSSQNSSLDPILAPPTPARYIFFGGKGGVGKTSSAAAAAVHCAAAGLTTLVISTDPAHSLGDALRLDLSDGDIRHVDPQLPLYAIESDTRRAVEDFRTLVASLSNPIQPDSPSSSSSDPSADGWSAVAQKLGLEEFSEVLETIPPGADELIALVAILDNVQQTNPQDLVFDRIIFDTAPTGHTLRFLTFPDFLDNFLTQALSLRDKLKNAGGVLGTVSKMFMGSNKPNVDVNGALDVASKRVGAYRDKMVALAELFRDPTRSEFVVVTIATVLAVEETKRLVNRLWDDGIWVRHLIVNQIIPQIRQGNSDMDDDPLAKYLKQVRRGQAREISFATEQIADEFGLSVTLVPRFDTEVCGVYGLQALAQVAFREGRRESYGKLFNPDFVVERAGNGEDDGLSSCQFIFVGGKGGVGKTSMSAAMGVALSQMGLKTLVLSTDPAHSLGDVLQQQLDGGMAVPVTSDLEGGLFAMEIDTTGAVEDFQRLARDYVAEGRRGVGVDMARKLGLDEFAQLLDNAPPGIDELVALTRVIELVKFGDFDRVVVDTAPTGHTLRLLSFPEFLESFLGKVGRLKKRLDSGMDALKSVLGRRDPTKAVEGAAKGVEQLRRNMGELRQLVGDEERTQFAIVTVPTGLAMAESERLVRSLKKDEVSVGNLIINQIVPDGSAQKFVNRVVGEQEKCVDSLKELCGEKGLTMVEVPYFDVEVRGVYGLMAMAAEMFSKAGDDEGSDE